LVSFARSFFKSSSIRWHCLYPIQDARAARVGTAV
jgi:hypothetical protein